MDLVTFAEQLDQNTARTFVRAARQVIDALLIEAQHVQQTQTPAARDYNDATLSREAPAGGWLSDSALRDTVQQLAEAISAEKWTDGFVCAVRLLGELGG